MDIDAIQICTYTGPLQWLSGKESAFSARAAGDVFLIPGSERSPGGGHGNPLQSSCWRIPWTEEPGSLQSIESQSQTWPRQLHTHAHTNSQVWLKEQRKSPVLLTPTSSCGSWLPGRHGRISTFSKWLKGLGAGTGCPTQNVQVFFIPIKQLEPPIKLTYTSLLVYLETSELAEYTRHRPWRFSRPLTKPLSNIWRAAPRGHGDPIFQLPWWRGALPPSSLFLSDTASWPNIVKERSSSL